MAQLQSTVVTGSLYISGSDPRVGIGTTSPGSALDVAGILTINTRDIASNPRLVFNHDNILGASFIEVDRGTEDMEFWVSGSERMRIMDNGNVGIGTDSPSDLLHLLGNTNSFNTAPIIRFDSTSTSNANVRNWAIGPADTEYGNFHIYKSTTRGGDPVGSAQSSTFTIDYNGNVGIGTSNPGYKLEVNGNAEFLNNVNIKNNSYDDYQIAVDSVGFSIYNRTDAAYNMTIDHTGNVGIGTISPSAVLHLAKPSTEQVLAISGSNGYNASLFMTAAGSGKDARVVVGNSRSLLFDTTTSPTPSSTGTTKMVLTNTGNVGIGTTSPNARLEIEDNGTTETQIVKITADDANPYGLAIGNDTYSTTDYEGLGFVVTNDGIGTIDARGTGAQFRIRTGATPTEAMRIDSSGNVGIGTTSVSSGFRTEIAGGDFRVGDTQGEDGVELGWSAGGSQGFVQAYDRGDSAFRDLMLNNSLLINSSGNVGIGTTSPATKFEVRKDSSDTTLTAITSGNDTISLLNETDTTNNYTSIGFVGNAAEITARIASVADASNGRGNLVFLTGDSSSGTPAERMRINSSGNVGIGTTSPTSYGSSARTLEIRGNTGTGSGLVRVSNADNSVGTSLYSSTSAGTLNVQTNHPLTFATNNSERMRIDSSGRLFLGTATVAAANAAADDFVIKGEGTAVGMTISNSSDAGTGTIFFGDSTSSAAAGFRYNHNTGDMAISAEDNITITADAVGIGVNNPPQKLTVDGTISGSSDLSIDGDSVFDGTVGYNEFNSGFGGTGWRIDSSSNAEFQNLTVRGTFSVYELLAQQIRATNGSLLVATSGKVDGVDGTTLLFDSGSRYGHGFAAGDVLISQRLDPVGGELKRTFITVDTVANTGSLVYKDLSGDSPEIGQDFVRIGNTGSIDRQGHIYLTADDTYAPYIGVRDGLSGSAQFVAGDSIEKVRVGKLDGITSSTFGSLSGYGFWATGNAYLEGGISATFGSIGGFGITATAISSSNDNLILRSNGDITGSQVQFTGGDIGGFSISQDALSGDNFYLSGSATGNEFFISASNFNVKANGDVTASNANIEGRIVAETGFIGTAASGFDINSSYFRNGTKTSYNDSGTGVYIGTDGIGLADTFSVSAAGALIATDATITGNITANNGQIGGFTISQDALSGGNFFLSGSATGNQFFISSSNFNVKANGDITGSSVLFDGGRIASFDIKEDTLEIVTGSTTIQLGELSNILSGDLGFNISGSNSYLDISSTKFQGTTFYPRIEMYDATNNAGMYAGLIGDINSNFGAAVDEFNFVVLGNGNEKLLSVGAENKFAGFEFSNTQINDINDNLILKANGQFTSSLALLGTTKVTGSLTTADIIPYADDTEFLGGTSNRWRVLYATRIRTDILREADGTNVLGMTSTTRDLYGLDGSVRISFEDSINITNGNVGIGSTDTPGALLELKESSNGAGDAVIRLKGHGNNADNTVLGAVEWYNSDSSGYQPGVVARVEAQSGNTNGHMGELVFKTHDGGGGYEGSPPEERMRIDSSGNVGIGTTSPGHPLTVAANPGAADTPVAWIHNSGNVSSYDGTVISTVNDGSDVEVLHVRTNNTTYANGTSLMLVRGDGNVGIGTDSPGSKLQVAGTIDVNTATSGLPTIKLSHTNAGADNFEIKAGTTGVTNGGFSIRDIDAAANRFVIDSDGDVGIGTSSPTAKLQVDGDVHIGSASSINSFGALQLNQTSNVDEEGIAVLSAAGGRSIRIWVDESQSYINSGNGGNGNIILNEGTGNVGIGNINPPEALTVQGDISASGDLHIQGNINGTLSPSGNLSISSGNVVLDSGQGIDFSATANSSGTMTSELLDDYEEGTWSPQWISAGFDTVTMNVVTATYTKIGNTVFINARVETNEATESISSPASVQMSGLPFTPQASEYFSVSVGYSHSWSANRPSGGYIQNFSSTPRIIFTFKTAVNGNSFVLESDDFLDGSNKNIIIFSATYQV